MEAWRDTIIISSIGVYMVLCVGVGLWAMRRTKTVRDFFVAGRDLGILVTGIAMFSSTMSGFGFVGGPGLVYALGMASVWIVITSAVGYAISDFLLGKRLRLFAGLRDSVSLPDAVVARYGDETSGLLTAIAILLGIMGYLATQILAMATVLQTVLQNTGWWPGITLVTCVIISVSVLLFYSVTGGIVASVYTDLVQGSIMIVAGVLIFLTTLTVMDGGATGAMNVLMQDDPEGMGPWGTIGLVGCMSWYFMFSVGSVGQPHIVTKAMMVRNIRNYRYMPVVTVIGYSLTALLWISIGLIMRALVVSGQHPELAAPDAAAAEFLGNYAHPLLAGVVFAGLFAAIMSTADAFLNIGAAALVHDIPGSLRRRAGKPAIPDSLEKQRRELFQARLGTVFLAGIAAAFALYSFYVNDRLVALLGAFGWGTFGAALVPAVAIGLNWKRATPLAANTAIVFSLVVNFGIEVFNVRIPGGVHGGTVALLGALLLFFGISLASKPQPIDPEIEAIMDI